MGTAKATNDIKKTSPTSCVFCRHCKQPDRRRAFHRPNINTFFSLTILNKPHKTIKLTDLYSKADWLSLCLLLHCILGIVRSWEMISIATGLHGFALAISDTIRASNVLHYPSNTPYRCMNFSNDLAYNVESRPCSFLSRGSTFLHLTLAQAAIAHVSCYWLDNQNQSSRCYPLSL